MTLDVAGPGDSGPIFNRADDADMVSGAVQTDRSFMTTGDKLQTAVNSYLTGGGASNRDHAMAKIVNGQFIRDDHTYRCDVLRWGQAENESFRLEPSSNSMGWNPPRYGDPQAVREVLCEPASTEASRAVVVGDKGAVAQEALYIRADTRSRTQHIPSANYHRHDTEWYTTVGAVQRQADGSYEMTSGAECHMRHKTSDELHCQIGTQSTDDSGAVESHLQRIDFDTSTRYKQTRIDSASHNQITADGSQHVGRSQYLSILDDVTVVGEDSPSDSICSTRQSIFGDTTYCESSAVTPQIADTGAAGIQAVIGSTLGGISSYGQQAISYLTSGEEHDVRLNAEESSRAIDYRNLGKIATGVAAGLSAVKALEVAGEYLYDRFVAETPRYTKVVIMDQESTRVDDLFKTVIDTQRYAKKGLAYTALAVASVVGWLALDQ